MIDYNHDHHDHHVGIAFGSCNRPLLPQSYWKDIESYHPSYYLWTGDAIYAKNHTIQALEHAYYLQLTNEFYRNFIHSDHGDDDANISSSNSLRFSIDGIWDDHDYGVNDGGRYVHQQDQRRQLYHDFITSSNSGYNKDQHQSHQHGSSSSGVQNDSSASSSLLSSSSSSSSSFNLYHTRDIHLDGLKIKIIFLDTRSHRDDHYIKSLGMS